MTLERIGIKPIGKVFPNNAKTENDLNDFKMPYRFYGLTELEVMIDKYKRLDNASKGLSVRYGRKLF